MSMAGQFGMGMREAAKFGREWAESFGYKTVREREEARERSLNSKGRPSIAQIKADNTCSQVAGTLTDLRPGGSAKLKGRCPFHEERTPSFYVFTDSDRWRCFGACAEGGDVYDLMKKAGTII